jgi:hypothetical protein
LELLSNLVDEGELKWAAYLGLNVVC